MSRMSAQSSDPAVAEGDVGMTSLDLRVSDRRSVRLQRTVQDPGESGDGRCPLGRALQAAQVRLALPAAQRQPASGLIFRQQCWSRTR
jgi:hypothetical protein